MLAVARTPVFGFRGSSLANATNGKVPRLPSGSGVESKREPQTSTAEEMHNACLAETCRAGPQATLSATIMVSQRYNRVIAGSTVTSSVDFWTGMVQMMIVQFRTRPSEIFAEDIVEKLEISA